ncbi:amidohydrolase family protein [Rasiella rasia]|uniref:Amidohydrolase family protein n=1 Tax=Rasiella rasia TaxID=2744027 RepID=A0A6G6GJM1_9FLAO|nr:amidohydrolase family protein [Rasiella rasia]QIE58738.1 amidohydrolase family protein [Rasiella rasia]
MKRIIFGIICSIFLLSFISCKNKEIQADIVITNVNIIDVENQITNSSQTIAIENGKIILIEPYSDSSVIKAETIIDGTNKYLIPSLWDMHTHYTTSNKHKGFLNLFMANGVLGVRDLWGSIEARDSLVASNTLMPRIFLSGHIIDGPFTLLQGTLQPKSADEAIHLVDSLHQKGADFIKVYDDLSKDIYEAISLKCKELNLPFTGHTPDIITAIDASELGQKSIEHLNGIFESCSSQQSRIDSLEVVFKHAFMQRNIPNAIKAFTEIGTLYSSTLDEDELNKLSNTLVKNKTFITPTLITLNNHWYRKEVDFTKDSINKYIPLEMFNGWDPNNEFPTNMFPEETWESGKKMVSIAKTITNKLNKNGVKLLAGTDCGVSYVVPGFSIHNELKLLVKSGLTNGEALQTATINPSLYFNLSDSLGTVTENKIADLVLLNNNPLEKIENTQTIFGVIQNGKYLDRNRLNELLKNAEIIK